MCIFRERFEEAEQICFPQQFCNLIIVLIKWGPLGGQHQCAISKGSSLRRLTWAAQCTCCERTKRIAEKNILLRVDLVRSVLLNPTFQQCHASGSNYLAHGHQASDFHHQKNHKKKRLKSSFSINGWADEVNSTFEHQIIACYRKKNDFGWVEVTDEPTQKGQFYLFLHIYVE